MKHVVVAAASLLVASAAQALPLVGSSGGSFSSLSSCDSSGSDRSCRIVSTSNGPSTGVEWGSKSTYQDFVSPSRLTAADLAWNTETDAIGLVIGQLNWFNSSTVRTADLDLFGVRWTLTLKFTSPSWPDPNGTEKWDFTINNTLNPAGDLIYGLGLADLSNLGNSFSLNGVTVSNLRYRVIDGAGSGSSSIANNVWYNDEGNNSSLQILGDFRGPVVSPIPEPETYAMLIAGLALVGFVRRRKGARQQS